MRYAECGTDDVAREAKTRVLSRVDASKGKEDKTNGVGIVEVRARLRVRDDGTGLTATNG